MEKRTYEGRLCELYYINQFQNVDKGEGGQKNKYLMDVISGRSLMAVECGRSSNSG